MVDQVQDINDQGRLLLLPRGYDHRADVTEYFDEGRLKRDMSPTFKAIKLAIERSYDPNSEVHYQPNGNLDFKSEMVTLLYSMKQVLYVLTSEDGQREGSFHWLQVPDQARV